MPHQAIRIGFRQARRTPRARHRDIAQAMGISEAELISAHCGDFSSHESPLQAWRLRGEWSDIIAALPALGEVMTLVRNEHCIHEKVGTLADVRVEGPQGREVGLALGELDLRLFYGRWAHGFSVQEVLLDGTTQRSWQFFDGQGVAILKVFLRAHSRVDAHLELVERFAHPMQVVDLVLAQAAEPLVEQPDQAVDIAGFRQAWIGLRDTHDFFPLLRRFGLTRTQALRLAPPDFAQQLHVSCAHEVLSLATQHGAPIMVFVGNVGVIQIHAGEVRRLGVLGPWINVLDERFNLHLREDSIASTWLVKKPTVDGLVHSLELFDARGDTIAMFFGERKPGHAERCEWRQILAQLTPEVQACVA